MKQPNIELKYKRIPTVEGNSYTITVQYSWGALREYVLVYDYVEDFFEWDRRIVRYIRAFLAWGNAGKVDLFGQLPIDFITEEVELDEFQDLIERGEDTVENLGSPRITSIIHHDSDGDSYNVTYDEV